MSSTGNVREKCGDIVSAFKQAGELLGEVARRHREEGRVHLSGTRLTQVATALFIYGVGVCLERGAEINIEFARGLYGLLIHYAYGGDIEKTRTRSRARVGLFEAQGVIERRNGKVLLTDTGWNLYRAIKVVAETGGRSGGGEETTADDSQ